MVDRLRCAMLLDALTGDEPTMGGTVMGRIDGLRRFVRVGATVVLAAAMAGAALGSSAGSRTASALSVPQQCTVSGPVTPTGSTLISGPMVQQITGAPLPLTFSVDASTTPQVNPGGTIATSTTLQLDLASLADDLLVNRVKPAIVSAGFPQLADSAWVVLDLTSTTVTFPQAAGTTPLGSPTASASSAATSASWGTGGVVVALGGLTADTRTPGAPLSLATSWSVADSGAAAPRSDVVAPPTVSLTAAVTVGVLFSGVPITGGATAPWTCAPADPTAALASTAVVDGVLASSTTGPTSVAPSSTAAATTTTVAAPTTTAWPTSTTTPSDACSTGPLDRYGGDASITLQATGFFRTASVGGRWWLVDPDGHPFFSAGINHVTFAGTPDRYGNDAYHQAAVARYGTAGAWATAQLQRMQAWGYNTLGAWSDTDTFASRVPYTLLLDLTGQSSSTGEMQDLWDPAWAQGVTSTVDAAAAAHGDDPELLGYWTDNELHWGPDWRPLHLFDEYLARPAGSPGKQVMVAWLQQRYPTFAAFAADFTTTATDWTSLAGPTQVTSFTPAGGAATRSAWVGVVAERYFSFTDAAIRAADPHHLDLGPRLIAQTAGTPVLEAAARYVDVASFNLYTILPELVGPLLHSDPTYLPVDGGLAAQEQVLHKPVLISEWSFRAADSGLPNTWPPLFPVLPDQAARATAYESFVSQLLATTWVVGQHWFEHADEPPAGRSDGEDSNFGLVDLHDDPYPALVAISRTMHDCAYARLHRAFTPVTAVVAAAPGGVVPEAAPATAVVATPRYTG